MLNAKALLDVLVRSISFASATALYVLFFAFVFCQVFKEASRQPLHATLRLIYPGRKSFTPLNEHLSYENLPCKNAKHFSRTSPSKLLRNFDG